MNVLIFESIDCEKNKFLFRNSLFMLIFCDKWVIFFEYSNLVLNLSSSYFQNCIVNLCHINAHIYKFSSHWGKISWDEVVFYLNVCILQLYHFSIFIFMLKVLTQFCTKFYYLQFKVLLSAIWKSFKITNIELLCWIFFKIKVELSMSNELSNS